MRFRDLVTDIGETIQLHSEIIDNYGKVFWGWWMKPNESFPQDLFNRTYQEMKANNSLKILLFDSGNFILYEANLIDIKVGPGNKELSTPNPELTPSYYHSASYPAWFVLDQISIIRNPKFKIKYLAFPTRSLDEFEYLVGTEIKMLDDLKNADVTLWEVELVNS